MGVDAVIRLETPPPPHLYEMLAQQFRQDWPVEDAASDGLSQDYPSLDAEGEVQTLWRYYGYGYERGPWPKIRECIEWLMAHTECPVLYGGDCDDDLESVTPEFLEAMSAHFEAVGHEPYRSLFR